ncbi:MAG: DUF1761 domain-containing protein [Terracidiphilus sp.]
MGFFHFNHMHVFLAALLQWVIGAVWYSPVLFANPWTSLAEVRPEAKGFRMVLGMIISFLGCLIVCFALMHVIWWSGVNGFKAGAKVGLVVWAGFICAPLAAQCLYDGRPFKHFAATSVYWLVVLVAAAALLSHWG